MGNKSQKQNDYSYGYRGKLDTKVDLKSSQPILDVILRNGGYLYGGIVYKTLLRGEPTHDIDGAVSKDKIEKTKQDLKKECQCVEILMDPAYFPSGNHITTLNCKGTYVDITDKDFHREYFEETRNYFHNVVWTSQGYRHIWDAYCDPFGKEFHYHKKVTVIDDIKNKRYIPWRTMRSKDYVYLKDWTKI